MRITHLNNAFMMIEAGGTRLLCDPWVGMANEGGWHSFPEFDRDALMAFCATADAVYISHIHADHFDPAFLSASGLTTKPFVIKHFANRTLYSRLQRLGVATIHELPGFTPFTLGGMTVVIVPQMTSNTAGLDEDIDYDLDTSILVHGDGQTLFNQVDNPLSLSDYTGIKTFIDQTFGPLDMACLMTGAASGYPQAFLNIDRAAEQQAVIGRSLDKFSHILDILRPANYMPSGGTYIIPGRYSHMSRYIAQPTLAQLFETVSGRARCFEIEGGRTLDLASFEVTRSLAPLENDKAKAMDIHARDPYPHDAFDDSAIRDADVRALFDKAYAAYSRKVAGIGAVIDQNIVFHIHDRLTFDDEGRILSPVRAIHALTDHGQPQDGTLIIHLDRKLFIKGLSRAANWNQLLALAVFERAPNLFRPTAEFSLNFLIA